MNKILADVYLQHRKPKWGKGIEGMSFDSDKDLECIVMGNVELREQQRERFNSAQFEEFLSKKMAE